MFIIHCSCKKVVEESNKENFKVIKNTLPDKSGLLKNLKKVIIAVSNYCGVLEVVLCTVLCFKWSVKKYCVAKILQGIWEWFLFDF